MKIGPTIDGRIKLFLDTKGDRHLLSQLVIDAYGAENIELLVDQIGAKSSSSDWEEFVKPELVMKFQNDILTMSNQVKKMHEEKEDEIFISKEDSTQWYSTLNQARLHLESQFNLSEFEYDFEDSQDLRDLPPHLLEPTLKNSFYTYLQSLILEYLYD